MNTLQKNGILLQYNKPRREYFSIQTGCTYPYAWVSGEYKHERFDANIELSWT